MTLAFRILAGTALAMALALIGIADAQMIRRAENANVRFAVSAPVELGETVTVSDGDTIWTETMLPTQAVRLIDPTPERNRPRPADGIEAGTLLFGVTLSDSVAYCQPIDYEAAVRRVQCYRDIDGNGTFDGTYLSRQRGLDARYLIAFVHALTAAGQIRYEAVSPAELPAAPSAIVLDIHRGEPMFRRVVDEEILDTRFDCTPLAGRPGECEVFGVRLAMEETGNNTYEIRIIDAAPDRGIVIEIGNTGL